MILLTYLDVRKVWMTTHDSSTYSDVRKVWMTTHDSFDIFGCEDALEVSVVVKGKDLITKYQSFKTPHIIKIDLLFA
jgi:hypothetical protein